MPNIFRRKKEAGYKNAHPITILFNLKRFFFLIIIPFLRGLFSALRGDFMSWVAGTWVDISIVLIMVGLSTIHWFYFTYYFDDTTIIVKKGWLQRSIVTIPWENISTISVIEPFYLKPFGVVFLKADALGGEARNSDIAFYLSNDVSGLLIAQYEQLTQKSLPATSYKPSFGSIALLSILSTSSLAGIIYIATFISQSGKILGRKFQDRLIVTFEELTRRLAFQIPPAAIAITYFFIIAWLIGFVFTLLRYHNFKVEKHEKHLYITGGLFSVQEFSLRMNYITYYDIRQDIFSYVLRVYSLYVSAIGFGTDKKDLNCLVPLIPRVPFKNISHQLFPTMQDTKVKIRPPRLAVMRYFRDPLILLGVISLSMVVTIIFIEAWKSFILFVGIMFLIPSAIFFFVRVIDYLTSGIGIYNQYFTVKYSKGFTLHTVLIPHDKVVKYRIRQTFLQKFSGRCDLYLHTISETRTRHRIRNLNLKETQQFVASVL